MTWIKKMMNRIFEADKNEEFEEAFEDIEYEEQIEKDQTKTEKPAFRFPIITDAEIYGWEPDPENERRKADNLITELDDDDFTPVPLYKNDRWPGGNEKPTIHRATAPLKYNTKQESNSVPSPKARTVKADETETNKKTIIQKRSNRPFTPTEVPSPVYGYSRPKIDRFEDHQLGDRKEATEENPIPSRVESEYEQKKAEPINEQSMADDEIHRIDLEEHAHTSGKEKFAETKIDEFVETESTEPVEREIETESTQPDEREIETESTEPDEQEIEMEPTAAELVGQFSETPNPTVKEEFEASDDPELIIAEEEIPASIEESMIEEMIETSSSEPVIEEVNEPERIHEQKKERIVPFNVLMLKNDKLKYEERAKKASSQSAFDSTKNDSIRTEPIQEITKPNEPTEGLEEQPYYAFPSKDFLIQPEEHVEDTEWLQSQSEKLEEALSYFAVQANVIEAVQGPTVTRFELTVGHGTKVSKVRNLTDDLKLALAAEDIRIQAPIPGTSSIGIEIPNRKPRAVRISEVIETKRFQDSESPLEAVLGLSLTGEPVTLDLRKMPHGMIAGATGSGKSVCINSILISLLYKASPTDLKMLLIDPKMVELAPFNGIPHLLSPVITDVKAATAALKWAVGEMERRYELFAHVGARNIERYNEMAEKDRKFSLKMPYLLIVIDELADLMMMAPADVEVSISRITQKARACGIHLIIATQRPSVDVITGTIKANVPTRIAFAVSSQIDSRTIIDTPGAERLLGKGDMLYLGSGQSSAVRLQGTFVTDAEIERIIEHVQNEAEPNYLFGQEDLLANTMEEEETDPLFADACEFIIDQGSASTSLLQRNFSIGYNRAAKLMDRMEKLGFISEQRGSKAREVYLTKSELDYFLNGNEKPNDM
ncbi:FtsK/SpoIIIE domain-containing protein [Sporosarcina luteola]|uniref:DNA translocase FtsK n=1 Tax=Bacillales TaxID=1385 RepID=UPI00203E97EB|nr:MULTISPECIES: DNA translocase FtsK [Bacillales]MCM3637111.1 FtsK/SpoIIIE domain-containing protein [Sporosarcina luteola]